MDRRQLAKATRDSNEHSNRQERYRVRLSHLSPRRKVRCGESPSSLELTQTHLSLSSPHCSRFAVRHTFFQQFVGGDTALECLPVVRKLRRDNIGTLFSYSVEATEEEFNAAAALGGGGEGASYALRRKNAEDHVIETIRAIVVSGSENKRYFEEEGVRSEGEVGSTWVACKMVSFSFVRSLVGVFLGGRRES